MSHRARAKNSPIIGAIINGRVFAIAGLFISLVNSFKASAKGWGRPIIPTLLGPFRSWM